MSVYAKMDYRHAMLPERQVLHMAGNSIALVYLRSRWREDRLIWQAWLRASQSRCLPRQHKMLVRRYTLLSDGWHDTARLMATRRLIRLTPERG